MINGGSRAGAGELAAHLERTDTNERMEVREMRGLAADNVREGLRQMEGIAAGTRCRKSLYHANINPGPTEKPLTPEQEARTIDRLEQRLGLEGHPRVVVAHVKNGRAHLHVVWSRIDQATMRAVSDSHNFRAHEEVARGLEHEFGHAKVKGAHAREDQARPPRGPRPAEQQQEARTKQKTARIAETVTELWREAGSGQAFAKAMERHGYTMAQGDRRGFCFVDGAGGVHSLSRRIEGATAKEVRAKLAGLELDSLPTVDQARDQVRAAAKVQEHQAAMQERSAAAAEAVRKPEAEPAREVPPPEPKPTPAPPPRAQRDDSARPRSRPAPLRDPVRDLGRAAGKAAEAGATRAAGGFMGAMMGLLGKAARYADQASGAKPGREDEQDQKGQRQPPVTARPAPAQPASPKPRAAAPPTPAPPKRSVADELAGQAQARGGSSKPARETEPPRDRERDRSRFTANRPAIGFLGAVIPDQYSVAWAVKARDRLKAYAAETGEYVLTELEHLNSVISGAYLMLGLTLTGQQRMNGGPA